MTKKKEPISAKDKKAAKSSEKKTKGSEKAEKPSIEAEAFELNRGVVPFAQIEQLDTFSNSRHRLTNIDDLAASIEASGLLEEPIVWAVDCEPTKMPWGTVDVRYFMIAGFRRMEAISRLRKKVKGKKKPFDEIPVKIFKGSLGSAMRLNLIENVQRDGLTPFEIGLYCSKIIKETGVSQAELSRQLGKSPAWISYLVNFVDEERSSAIAEIRDLVRDGHMGFSLARDVSMKPPLTQLKIANRIKSAVRLTTRKEDDDDGDPLKAELEKVKKEVKKRSLRSKGTIEETLGQWAEADLDSMDERSRAHAYTVIKVLEWVLGGNVDWGDLKPRRVVDGRPTFVFEG